MSSPDEFDDFGDDLFSDAQTLAALEAQAMKSSQAPKRHIQPYRHVTAAPKAGPSKPPPSKTTFGGRKEPGPINTEPRAGVGGFGWEHGGKRSMDGNVERYLAQVNDRQAYWQQGNGKDQEESYPDVVMTKDGGYGIEVGEVVDKHARPSMAMAAAPLNDQEKKEEEKKRTQGAAARRAAIAQASQQSAVAGPGPTTTRNFAKTTSVPIQQPQPQKFSANSRLLARSTSAGHHPVTRPLSRGSAAGALTPIPSEPSSQTPPIPASQGSLVRKAALELDEERRKREAIEAELEKVKRELQRQQKEHDEQRQKERMDVDVPEMASAKEEGENNLDLSEQLERLKSELYRATGEAQQVRRAQAEDHNRHLAEMDKMRLKYSDMEVRMKERDKETARQVENIRTQAVFSNHAVHNSAVKPRAASQRPMPTPLRNGSPRGKMNEESFLQRTIIKGKGKAAPIPGPKFGTLNNAFATSPTVSRVKRQRTTSVMPNGESSSPVRLASPLASPSRNRGISERPEPVSPSPAPVDDFVMLPVDPMEDELLLEVIAPEPEAEIEQDTAVDAKAELLYHIFNYIPPTRFQATFEKKLYSQTVLYRIINYRPLLKLDPEGRYGRACNVLLQACGETTATFESILQTLGEVTMECLQIVTAPLTHEDAAHFHLTELVATINILGLLAKTTWLFRSFAAVLSSVSSGIGSLLERIVDCVYIFVQSRGAIEAVLAYDFDQLHKIRNPPPPPAPPKHMSNTQAVLARTRKTQQAAQGQEAKDKENTSLSLTPEQQVWFEELAFFVVEATEALCYGAGEMDIWTGSELVDIAVGLTNPILPVDIVVRACRVVQAAGTFRGSFRPLLAKSARWPGEDPILDRVSRLMMRPPAKISDQQMLEMTMTLIRALAMLSISDRDAILLIGQRSLVTPALIVVVRRMSSRLWGVCIDEIDLQAHFDLLTNALTVFHHLLYPHFPWAAIAPSPSQRAVPSYADGGPDPVFSNSSPSKGGQDDRPQGVDLIARLKDPKINKEFNGLGHQFISALGAITFGNPVFEIDDLKGIDLLYIQDMAQDILNVVVEGPEEDAVYEMYTDNEEPPEEGNTSRVEDEVDEDAYKEVAEHHEESL